MELNERLEYMASQGISVTLMYHSEGSKWVCLWVMPSGKVFKGESEHSPDSATMICCENEEAGKDLSQ